MDRDPLIADAVRGDLHSIGRLITKVEEGEDGDIFKFIAKHSGKAHIVGFTGAPGVGKSSLISAVAALLSKKRKRVGIVAIDPSSPISGGAFLGDRIRMVDIALDKNVFIRSMGSRGALGGLARSAGEVALLMDALGFDCVLIETVGAGQSDIEVMKWVHSVVVMVAPGGGDDIQFAKAGIMEIGDAFVVNKSDVPGADTTHRYLLMELEDRIEKIPVIKTSTTKDSLGIAELVETLNDRYARLKRDRELEILKYRILSNKTRLEILQRVEAQVDSWLVKSGKSLLSAGLSPDECADKWEKENEY